MSKMMTEALSKTGWSDKKQSDPEIVALREHLEAHNGMPGLEIFSPSETDAAVKSFHKNGFVVIHSVLNDEEVEQLQNGCFEVISEILDLDASHQGNRGSHRYSFGGSSLTRSQLHRPVWQMLLNKQFVLDTVAKIFGSRDYMLRAASGDFCLPGAVEYQRLHSDVRDWESDQSTPFSAFYDPTGAVTIRDLPCPYLCVNFLPQDITRLNGPTRQIPGTQNARAVIPSLTDEPEWMRLNTVCPAPAGSIMIRDTRAWHGGTPNLSDAIRSIPNLEFYAPWFREPIVPGIDYSDYKQLSDAAQRVARFSVADSSVPLKTGTVMRAPATRR